MRKTFCFVLAMLAGAMLVQAQITIPYSFSAGTVIDPDQMNANFTAVGTNALNRTGGTITGALTSSGASLAGTWSGSPTFSGTPTFSGVPVFGSLAVSTAISALAPATVTVGYQHFYIRDSDASHSLLLSNGSNMTADRVLSVVTGDADRTLTLTGNATLNQDVSTAASPTFVVPIAAGYRENYATKTTSFTAALTESFIACDATGGAVTATLPAASTAGAGRLFNVKKIDTGGNACTLDGNGSETIDGSTTAAMTTPFQSLTIISDGVSAWYIK